MNRIRDRPWAWVEDVPIWNRDSRIKDKEICRIIKEEKILRQKLKKNGNYVRPHQRKIAGFLAVVLLAVLIVPLFQYTVSHAASGVVDGNTWYYTLSNGCATHVYPSGTITLASDGSLTVPEKIGAYTVTTVGKTNYSDYADATSWGDARSIYLPDTVTAIETIAFEGNSSLTKISGRGVTSVGVRAFYRNAALKEVYFPNLATIEEGSFSYCRSLESAYFPKLVSIGTAAFYQAFCDSASFYIGNKVTSIRSGAFYGANLRLLEIHAASPVSTDDNGNDIFNNRWADYSGSSYYSTRFTASFEHCTNLTDVVIGAEAQFFWGRAFSLYKQIDRTFYFLNPSITLRPSYDNFSHYTDSPPSGYMGGCKYGVMNLIYSPGNTYLNEYVQKYATRAADQVNVYSPAEWEAMGNKIPSAIPKEYVKAESMTAAYSGSVTEGMNLDPAKVSITVRYNDGSKATIAGSASGVTFSTRVVSKVGANSITVSYSGLSAAMSVTGIAKVVTGITATLNESYLNANSVAGWNGTKKAFEVGSSLVPAMFTVKENYNNGTSATLAASAYTLNANRVNNLQGNVITVTKTGTAFTATVTVTGYSASLDGVMDDLNVPSGDYNALSKKITDMNNELIAKTGELNKKIAELNVYENAMKEIKASIGKNGSSVSVGELAELSAGVAQKVQELAELKKGLKELEAQLASVLSQEVSSGEAATIEDIRTKLEALDARLTAAEAQADALTRFVNAIKEQLGLSADATEEEVLAKIDELQTQLNATKDELGEFQAAMEKIKEQIGAGSGSDENMEELEAIIALVKEKTEKLEYMESQMKELEAVLNAMLLDDSSAEDATLESVKERLEAASAELESVREVAAGLAAFGDSIRSQLGLSSDATEEDVLAKIDEIQTQLDATKAELGELWTAMEKIKEQVGAGSDSDRDIKELEAIIALAKEKTEKLEYMESQMKELEATLNAMLGDDSSTENATLESVKERLEAASAELESVRETAAGLTEFGDSLRNQLGLSSNATEAEVLGRITELLNQVANDKLTKEQLVTELEGLKSGIRVLEVEKASLEAQLSASNKENTTAGQKISVLEKEKTDLISKVSVLEKDKAGLEKEKEGLTSKASALEKDKAGLEKDKEGLASKVSALEKDKTGLEKDKEGLASKVSALEKDKAGLEKDKAGLASKISTLEKDKAALSDKKGKLEQKNKDLDGKLKALQKENTALKETKAESTKTKKQNSILDSRADTLKGEKDALESKVNALETQNEILKKENTQLREQVKNDVSPARGSSLENKRTALGDEKEVAADNEVSKGNSRGESDSVKIGQGKGNSTLKETQKAKDTVAKDTAPAHRTGMIVVTLLLLVSAFIGGAIIYSKKKYDDEE